MGLNKAEQNLEMRAVRTIDGMQRDLRDIKTAQPLGADVLKSVGSPAGGFLESGPASIVAGSSLTFVVTFTPASNLLTLWNFAWTLFVDTDDAINQWPSGSNLTTNTREMFVFSWMDWADSGDIINARCFKVRVRNSDPSATTHNFYLKFRAYLPAMVTP